MPRWLPIALTCAIILLLPVCAVLLTLLLRLQKKLRLEEARTLAAEVWVRTTEPVELSARRRLYDLTPGWTLERRLAWLVENYPRGLVAAGLQGIDESLLQVEGEAEADEREMALAR